MEREMKKLLLVAVSVGVFLLVTITVAIVVLTPKAQTQEAAFYTTVPFTHGRVQPEADIINNIPELPLNIIEPQDIVTIADRNNGESVTIQVPAPTTAAAIPDETQAPAARAAPPATRPAPAAPAPAARTAPPPAVAARPPAPARTINDFWIQVGAFSAIVRAEDVRERLASSGLTSIIETRVVNGQNFYRVRLGPYTSEREANHWLAIVRTIDGFHDSQVRQTVRQQ